MELAIINPADGEKLPAQLHEKKTQELRAVTQQSADHSLSAMAAEAGFEDDIDIQPYIEEEIDVKEEAPKFRQELLQKIVERSKAKKPAAKDAPGGVQPLTAKEKRVLSRYIPRLFDAELSLPPRSLSKKEMREFQQLNPPKNPLSEANAKGLEDLIEKAGFDPQTTTFDTLYHALGKKKIELENEIDRRKNNRRARVEIGIDVPASQLEAVEVLQNLTGVPDAPKEKRTLSPIEQAVAETEREREKRDEKLKTIMPRRFNHEIEKFAKKFSELYESKEVKNMLAEQTRRRTEVSIPTIKPPTRLDRFINLFSSKEAKLAKQEEELKLREKKEQQDLRALLRKNPTFTKEGFIESNRLRSAIDGDFSSFDELREKIVERLSRTEQRLSEEHAADLGKKPIETLEEVADEANPDFKRLLANQELLERMLSLIDQREVFLEGKDLMFDEKKLMSPTTEAYKRLSIAQPKIEVGSPKSKKTEHSRGNADQSLAA